MHRIIDDEAIEQGRLEDLQDAQELLAKLNCICNRLEDKDCVEESLNLGEFQQARQYLSLLDHAEDVFKSFHELLDFAEGTAGDNKGRPWDWIERAKAVLASAEGNT